MLAMLTFLLQPAWCWPSQLRRAEVAASQTSSAFLAADRACGEPGEAVAETYGHTGHRDADCCRTQDALAQTGPLQVAVSLAIAGVVVPQPTVSIGAHPWNALPRNRALERWRISRPTPYHARTTRRLT
jgi:hypothetical protein